MKTIAKFLVFVVALCAIITYTVRANPSIFYALPPNAQIAMFTVSNFFWKPDLCQMLNYKYKILTLERMQSAIQAGGDLNATYADCPVLMLAINATHIKDHRIIMAIIDAGANLDRALTWALIKPQHGNTNPSLRTHPEVIKKLIDKRLEKGAGLNSPDASGLTHLMQAIAYTNSLEVVKMLIDAGADVNGVNVGTLHREGRGASVLMWAAEYYNDPAIIPMLIEAGANPAATDKEGKTVFDYAKNNEFNANGMRLALINATKK